MAASTTKLPKKEQQQTQSSLFRGMLVWFLDLILLNSLNSVACEWHWLTSTVGWMDTLQFLEIGISLVALVLIGYLIYVPWRNWRGLQRQQPAQNPHMIEDTQEDRGALLSFLAMGLNAFFFLFVIATLVLMFSFTACGQI
jgi:hypothetical protein